MCRTAGSRRQQGAVRCGLRCRPRTQVMFVHRVCSSAAARCADQTSDIAVYQTNRNLLFNGLTSMGCITVSKPDGAFYLFPQTLEADDRAFSERAKKYDLLVVPGADFGAPGHMRISYCVKTETIGVRCRCLSDWRRSITDLLCKVQWFRLVM